MNTRAPKVSIYMLAYNVGKFIDAALEGVLRQDVDFSYEIIIAEDCSTDNTRQICDRYAAQFPDKIRVLPSDFNRGIAGNAAKALPYCTGEYIAICDSDDIWIDSLKLKKQVEILDANPHYGAVYSDVEIISGAGDVIVDDQYDSVRRRYTGGKIFAKLLQGNFVNNSTGMFRRSLIGDYKIDPDRHYHTYDFLFWLHIASQSEFFFMNEKTTQYRSHPNSVTNSGLRLIENRKMYLKYLPSILIRFDECRPWSPSQDEKIVLFNKMLSVLLRTEADAKTKLKILRILPGYFPGIRSVLNIFAARSQKRYNYGRMKSKIIT